MQKLLAVPLVVSLLVAAACAEVLPVNPTPYGSAGQTMVFRADLSNLGLGSVQGVGILDKGTVGGSSGVFTGFDLDFVVLDRDGDLATTHDQFRPLETDATTLVAGARRQDALGGPSRYRLTTLHPGDLFGVLGNAPGAYRIDYPTATPGVRDAAFLAGVGTFSVDTSHGWISLGAGGSIDVRFPLVTIDPDDPNQKLYLLIGDAGQRDEFAAGNVEVVVYEDPHAPPQYPPEIGPGEQVDLDLRRGDVESWDWDLNGDGVFGDAFGPVQSVTYERFTKVLGLAPDALVDVRIHMTLTEDRGTQDANTLVQLVPEPASLGLLSLAAPLALRRKRRHRGSLRQA